MDTEAPQKTWTVLEVLQWGAEYLKKRGVSQPRLSLEWMLAKTLSLSRLEIYMQFERVMKEIELAEVKAMLQKRSGHMPVQYILGEWDFFGQRFAVAPNALIPRPETEILVETVLKHCLKSDINPASYGLDLGTGSGIIAVSLLRQLPSARCVAVDLSPEAIALAEQNAQLHQVEGRLQTRLSDWCASLDASFQGAFDWVVSNPPYVPAEQWDALPVEIRDFEPRLALWAGKQGLDCYRVLLQQVPIFLKKGGLLAMEIGDGQEQAIARIMQDQACWNNQTIVNDHNGIKRVIVATRH